MKKLENKPELIVALDVPSLAEAQKFVRLLKKKITIFKVGLELFTAVGPQAIRMIHEEGCKVFLDLKFHDIPNTVAKAVQAAVAQGVWMTNVHAQGGEAMMEAAARSAGDKLLLIGVTKLTSDSSSSEVVSQVLELANSAKFCGLSGVVCSVQEARSVRKSCGKDFIIVTPGIRPHSLSGSDDQKRVATAKEAILEGSNYLVVGRPVLQSDDPLSIVESLLAEMSSA